MRGALAIALLVACGGDSGGNGGDDDPGPLPAPSCAAGGGGTAVAAPALRYTLADRWHEAWLASPGVADLDGDGTIELVVPRHEQLIVWHTDGTIAWRATLPGRIWSSPVTRHRRLAQGRRGPHAPGRDLRGRRLGDELPVVADRPRQ